MGINSLSHHSPGRELHRHTSILWHKGPVKLHSIFQPDNTIAEVSMWRWGTTCWTWCTLRTERVLMFTHGLNQPAVDPALNAMAGCSPLFLGSLFFSTCVLTHSWRPLCCLNHSVASSWYLTDCPDGLARTSFEQKPTFCNALGQVQAVYSLFQP